MNMSAIPMNMGEKSTTHLPRSGRLDLGPDEWCYCTSQSATVECGGTRELTLFGQLRREVRGFDSGGTLTKTRRNFRRIRGGKEI